ncbi:amino acid adenylation domain-containing protein [Streptomyces sp. DSM 44915]|uniref:Phenyloxazoline synthase MbtB n=1 Tax=Streptomyces chisholmiae TaxID=3075540 RepID=A0ABU2JWA5_9ACTN|nr:non-ribosomal peptide synthetase [Streptomyces sp. DSM 44915]MDT0269016.1 amino acid adenylation domain-containing protein [Streptomyces sp. DSM 44915]
MTAQQIVAELEQDGIRLWAEDGALRFRAPRGALTEERRATLRAHRDEVLAHLTARAAAARITPDPAAAHAPFPLTDIQAAYLVGRSEAYGYGGVACHVYLELAYPADTDQDRLTAAWWQLVRRHPMLRATVHPDGSQEVLPELPERPLERRDLRGAAAEAVAARVAEVRDELATRVPATDQPPLWEARLTHGDDALLLHLSMDQLIVDYASLLLVLAELEDIYHGRPLPELEIGFRDYVLARRQQTLTAEYDRHRAYWLGRLPELPGAPELPLAARADAPGPFTRLETVLDPARARAFAEHAAAHGLTVSGAVLTAYAEVVGRWSGSPRFLLNVPTFTRLPLHAQVDQLVGDFTAVELLEVDLGREQDFADRAGTLGATLLDDLSHGLFTGSQVLAELSRAGAAGPLLMPVVFTSTLGSATTRRPAGEVRYARTQTPQVWLDCQVMERGDRLALSWDVRQGVLADGTAEDMFAAFTALVTTLADDPAAWRAPAAVPLPAATRAVRERVNATAAPVPRARLQDAVLATAARVPDRIAVLARDRALTYRELAAHAHGVARALRAAGVGPGDTVAITTEKGWEQPVAVLGTLLAGAAYLPLDTNQPRLRRDAIFADAKAAAVLSQSWLTPDAHWPADLPVLPVDATPPSATPVDDPGTGPDDLAYVIYTSGSTGAPKGVLTTHAAALNTVVDINRRFAVTADDRVFALAQLGFDLSVYDIFGPLAEGAALVLPDPQRRGDPSSWAELVRAEGVTVWNSVPGQLQMLHDYLRADDPPLPSLRLALLSGDWIPPRLPPAVTRWAPAVEVHSLGGATEAAIWSIHHPIRPEDAERPSVPYGRPLANQTFHVLDGALRPRPDLVPGELYIGGVGLAQGYLGDAPRTAERFVHHPVTGERLYHTGDLGRYHPDGTIEFLGRDDQQVKVRGYRIELGEIRSAVESLPGVAAGAVVVAGGRGDTARTLVGFVEPARHDPPPPPPAWWGPATDRALAAAVADLDIAQLAAFRAALGDAARAATAAALAPAFARAAGPRDAATICADLDVRPAHHRLVRRWLRGLAAAGWLTEQPDGGYLGLRAPDPAAVAERWERAAALERAAGWSAELLATVRGCADILPRLLTGRHDAAELPFAGASPAALAAAYRDNAPARALHRVLAAGVADLVSHHQGAEAPRVLEVGLRGGGAVGEVLAALDAAGAGPVDYLATDPSPRHRAEVEGRFTDDPRVRVADLDPAAEPRAQGLAPNSFDVLVCVGVLDNLPDVPAALRRLRSLVAPGGWLVLLQNTDDDDPAVRVSTEFLAEHAGPFADLREAAEQTFLHADQWAALLTEDRGRLLASYPPAGPVADAFGQRLFFAQPKPDRAPVTPAALTEHAGQRLPEYAVPTRWQVLDALPRTANGKVDRDTLTTWAANPEQSGGTSGGQRPRDDLERALAALWAELLGRDDVGRDDDLFALGGDSLLVARIVGRLREGLAGVEDGEWDLEWEVVLRHLLREPTVAGLAGYLRGLGPAGESATGAEATPVVPLRAGAGPTTVLVHAGTGTLLPYRPLITRLRALAGDHALVGLEIPELDGFLNADATGLIDRIAARYARALLDAGHERFDIVGYCVGGVIATEVARVLADAGAEVRGLTVISSHSPTFRIDDELLSEYSFALMMGMDLAHLGFPADQRRVGAAVAAVLDRSPDAVADGAIADLDGTYADIGAAFAALEALPRMARVTRMVAALPPELADTYQPEGLLRALRTYQQSTFALSRHRAEPYAGDITFLRHNGAYPFPGSADTITDHWARICLGELRTRDIPGEHFTCMTGENVPTVVDHLTELIEGIKGDVENSGDVGNSGDVPSEVNVGNEGMPS